MIDATLVGELAGDASAALLAAMTASSFASMKEYQAVMLRLTKHVQEDEEALTDLLNERSRGGWVPALISQDSTRVIVVFERSAES